MVAPIRVTTLPATFPQAKLIAPRWAKASSSVTAVVTTKPAASTTSRRPCMNSRLIRLNGTHTNPSMSTHSDSSWIRLVAPGDPRKVATEDAKKKSRAVSTALEASDRVSAVRAIPRMSPSQRTTARLTPISLALSTTDSTSWEMA